MQWRGCRAIVPTLDYWKTQRDSIYKSTLVEVLRRIVSRSVRQGIVFFPWIQSLLVLQIVQIYIWSLSVFYFYFISEQWPGTPVEYICGRTGALLRDPFYLQRDKVWYQDIEKNTEKTLPDQGRRGDHLCSWMRQKAVKTAKRYQRIRDLSCEIQRIQSKDPYLRRTEQLLKNR